MQTKVLEPFPSGENPFIHDLFHMGTRLGKDVIVMHRNHPHEECKYLIVVDVVSGERLKISFERGNIDVHDG